MEISKRVECVLDADAERVSTEQSVGAKVTLILQSGKTVERFIEAPKGSASRPFTVDDHVARFTQEMLKRFSAAQVDALLEEVRGFARSAESRPADAVAGGAEINSPRRTVLADRNLSRCFYLINSLSIGELEAGVQT